MAHVIAVVNQKGGVGKTTTSVNLAASLAAQLKRRVLLVDLDPQGNATSGVGVYLDAGATTIYHAIVDGTPITDAIRPTEIEGLSICPADTNLVGAEVELVAATGRELRLKTALAAVQSQADIILLDCPPSLGLLTLNALTAADGVLIPLQCEYYALEGLAHLMHTVSLVRESLNPQLSLDGILLTMFDARNNLSHKVEQEVRTHFAGKVFQTIIPRNVRLSEAPSHGKPGILYDIASRGVQAYIALAEELAATMQATHAQFQAEPQTSLNNPTNTALPMGSA